MLSFILAAFILPKTANYWCTWETQNYTIDPERQKRTLGHVGDQGAQGARDNIDYEVIFGHGGKRGWIDALPPETRCNLYFLIDDGWDVGYGHGPGSDVEVFGSLIVATNRFPQFAGSPAERLRRFNQAVRMRGWKGLGLWCATQCTGEKWSGNNAPLDVEKIRRVWREKLEWVRDAGIGYLKFDWGARSGNIGFRRILSDLAREICPETTVEHCTGAWPINEPERMIGNAAYDENRARAKELMAFADVFRIYDLLNPFTTATAMERVAFYLGVQADAGGTCLLSTEDEIYLGASLGCAWGAMRSPFAPDARYPVRPVNRKMTEVVRATAWQHLVAPFASRAKPKISATTLADTWFFKEGEGWYAKAQGHLTTQKAPAVVARGLELPTVRSAEADGLVPFVTACRSSDGSVSLGAIPRVDEKRGWLRPKAHLAIAERPSRLAVFGYVASVSFPSDAKRLFARDLAGGDREEITAACTFKGGVWTVPGDVLNRVGTAKNAAGDESDPGTLVETDATVGTSGLGLVVLGDGDAERALAKDFEANGCVTVTARDGRTAVARLRTAATARGIDPKRIGVYGRGAAAGAAAELACAGEVAFALVEDLTEGAAQAARVSPRSAPICFFGYDPSAVRLGRDLRRANIPCEFHFAPTADARLAAARGFVRQLDLDRRLGPEIPYRDHLAPARPMKPVIRENVWPDGKTPNPDARQCVPFIEWHVPEKLTTKAIQIVYSGGGYFDNHPERWDGIPAVRRYLNAKGMAVVVLKYRTPRPEGLPKHLSAWQDLQRAVRLVRSEAASRGLDGSQIGILGPSAGGHLTLMGATSSAQDAYQPIDAVDDQPCGVQWAVAAYPAYVLTDGADGPNRHRGNDDGDALVGDFAFDAQTAPILFLHGDADVYSPMGSLRCHERLRRMGVRTELHTLARRGHCFMNEASVGTLSYDWMDLVWSFLRPRGSQAASDQGLATSVALADWRFSRDGRNWQSVRVPHDWAIAGPFDREIDKQVVRIVENQERTRTEKTGRTGSLPWIGSGEYRTRITIPTGTEWASLVFSGAMSEPEVFVDGVKVGGWKFGYTPFEIEIPAVAGEHEVAVKLTNRPLSSRWYPGAGLYRPVALKLGGAVGVRTWGESVHSPDGASFAVTTELRNPAGVAAKVGYRVLDADGREVAAGPSPLKVPNPRRWSPEDPYLYTLETRVTVADRTVETRRTRVGLRTVEYGPGFFKLNGVKRKFKGVCLHHDLGPLGAAFDADAFRRQVLLLKEMGCDSIRTSHNIPAPEQLAVCDELGMMVMAESFDAWEQAKVANGYNLWYADWWTRDLRQLVLSARNHPSVVMWSIGNEIPDQSTVRGALLTDTMQKYVHTLDPDPNRLVTQGASWMPNAIESGVIGAMEIPAVTYRLPFYGAIHAATPKQGMVLGAETASTVSSRGVYKFPDEPCAMKCHPDGQSSGYDVEYCIWSNLPDDDWAMQDDHDWTIGEFVWTGFDYLGEPTPYDRYWPSRSSYFGIFDLAGLPKDRYWLYRSRWNTSSHTLHLLPHWTWPGREGQVTPVYCYTDFDEAELFVNGRSQGRRRKDPSSRLDRYRLRWRDVVYEPGELKVVAYDAKGAVAQTETVRTAGAFARFEEKARDVGRLRFVTVTAVDAKGTACPDCDAVYEVKPPAGWRFKAICNGDATSLERFVRPKMKLFKGQLVYTLEKED